MNRNKEWEIFVDEVKGYLPSQIDFSAQKAVWNIKDKPHIGLLIKAPIAGLFTVIVIFVTLANASTRFGKATKSVPFLYWLARLVTFNPSLRTANMVSTVNLYEN